MLASWYHRLEGLFLNELLQKTRLLFLSPSLSSCMYVCFAHLASLANIKQVAVQNLTVASNLDELAPLLARIQSAKEQDTHRQSKP